MTTYSNFYDDRYIPKKKIDNPVNNSINNSVNNSENNFKVNWFNWIFKIKNRFKGKKDSSKPVTIYTVKVYENGLKVWYKNGKRHRVDGLAIE
jgi:hypothetical protein